MSGMADGGREVRVVMKVSLERECVMDRLRKEFGGGGFWTCSPETGESVCIVKGE